MYKHYCVIDGEGLYTAFVLEINGEIFGYVLNDGEALIDAQPPPDEAKIRWNGEEWQ
jgi:hypothetical protein